MEAFENNIEGQFKLFKQDYSEFSGIILVKKDLDILYISTHLKSEFTDASTKNIINKWNLHENQFKINDDRYIILKSDPYQFCAINTKSRTGICGSITKLGNYCLGILTQGSNNSLIESSIVLNKWIWNQI
jgi:hypothetical protein